MKTLVFFKQNNNVIEIARKISEEVKTASFNPCSDCAEFVPEMEIRSFENGVHFIEYVEERISPDLMLFSDETIIRESAAFFAGKRKLGLISHSNNVYIKDGKIIGVVPGWENLSAEVYSLTKPVLLLLNSNTKIPFSVENTETVKIGPSRLKFKKDTAFDKNPLETAKVVIGIGRGVKKSLIPQIKKIAEKINAEIGCTRPVADSGILPLNKVIGDSGVDIRPKVYIALGISGAIQHTSGVNAQYVIAVNSDKNAPIFAISTLPILGKVEEIIPELEKWIKNIL